MKNAHQQSEWEPQDLAQFGCSSDFLLSLKELQKAFQVLFEKGHEAWLVGGEVRDELLGRSQKKKDFDVAVSASPEALEKELPGVQRISASFPVWMLRIPALETTVEVAILRQEGGYQGRFPSFVRPGTLQSDAARRDLTINSLYVCLHPKESFQLLDPNQGLQDLRARRLRIIGDPAHRLSEDYLRMVRLIRFAVNLEFTIDGKAWSALQSQRDQVAALSTERIWQEIQKVRPEAYLEFLRLGLCPEQHGLWEVFFQQTPLNWKDWMGKHFLELPATCLHVLADALKISVRDWWAFRPLSQKTTLKRDRLFLQHYQELRQCPQKWFWVLRKSREPLETWRFLFRCFWPRDPGERVEEMSRLADPSLTFEKLLRLRGESLLGFSYGAIRGFFQSEELPFQDFAAFLEWLLQERASTPQTLEGCWKQFRESRLFSLEE